MRCGILIIGSLLWDDGKEGRRAAWRAARLDIDAQAPVRTSIQYGRISKSRSKTYTMVFKMGEPVGQAILVPCTAKIKTINSLTEEANALWQAEDPNAKPGALHKLWGSVGALFGAGKAQAKLSSEWTAHFKKVETQCVVPVNANGLLDIGWPDRIDGQPTDFDVILATATKPAPVQPLAQAVADAWLAQNKGEEKYFFNNLKHRIRTPNDSKIWQRIEKKSPSWLKKKEYQPAIKILRTEAASLAQT